MQHSPHTPTKDVTRVLFRTHFFDETVHAFLSRIRTETGLPVTCVVAETRRQIPCGEWEKVPVTRQICESYGLYCPDNFDWLCGDYALHIARKTYPEVEHFWLIEYDVRYASDHLNRFFNTFLPYREVDFIAPCLGRSFGDWRWYSTMVGFHPTVFRCWFGCVRISARAIDFLYSERHKASACKLCSACDWPNDEAFVATKLAVNGFVCRDLNSFGQTFYTRQSLRYFTPIDGTEFDARRERDGLIYHPVLYGSSYQERISRFKHQGESHSRMYWRMTKIPWWPLKIWDFVVSRGNRKYGFWG